MLAQTRIAQLLLDDNARHILLVTGAGVEDVNEPVPNYVHAMCSLILARGGAHVTTNISGVQLLAQPDDEQIALKPFVAVHGLLYDQKEGRVGKLRRPRCLGDAETHPMLVGRSRRVPIPTQDVSDNDINVIEARQSAVGRTVLVIMGNSLAKSSNGRALNFLAAARDVSHVIFINTSVDGGEARVRSDLSGWGLANLENGSASPTVVECLQMDAVMFAKSVLESEGMDCMRRMCLHWISSEKVRRFRQIFLLPPVEDISGIRLHKLGMAGITVGKIFENVMALEMQACVEDGDDS